MSLLNRFSVLVFVVTLFLGGAGHAQVIKEDTLSNWRKAFKAGLNMNQAAFSSNWKAGGINSFGFNTFLNYKANYKKDKNSWNNEIDLLFGMVNNAGQGYRKTLDRFYMDTKYGRNLSKTWDFAFSFNFLSQFSKGYNYSTDDITGLEVSTLISDVFAPAFITTGFGFEYHPVDYFKVRISPFAPRITIVNDAARFITVDNPTPYGVTSGNIRYEWLAAQVMAEFNKDIAKNVNLKWRYVMFANYETFDLQRIDHRLDLNLTAKVNQFVNVSVGGIVFYDFDQDLGAQMSEAFSLGVMYTIQNYKE